MKPFVACISSTSVVQTSIYCLTACCHLECNRATEPLDSFYCQVKGPMPTLEGFMERHSESLNDNNSHFSHLRPRAFGQAGELDLRQFLRSRSHSTNDAGNLAIDPVLKSLTQQYRNVCLTPFLFTVQRSQQDPAVDFSEAIDSDFAALDRALQQERSQHYHGDAP